MNELSILEQLCFSTTRIEAEDTNGNKGTGTGFFFDLQIGEHYVPIVITNKHVVTGMIKGVFRLTKSNDGNTPIHTSHFTIAYDVEFEQMWTFHPDPNVDLCVLPLNPLVEAAEKMGHKLFYRPLHNDLIPNEERLKTLDVMENILMIGYPNGLWDSVNNMPIIRRGSTATDIKLNYNGKREFLIDAACFPGSSGSPVILFDKGGYTDKKGNLNLGGGRLMLLGILYAGPQLTVTGEIHVVTIPNIQKALSVSHIPNNLGYIIKSDVILDFISVLKSKYSL